MGNKQEKELKIGMNQHKKKRKKKRKKKKRIVYKKKTRSATIKITTEFEPINIPDFPIPNLKYLSVLFCSEINKPYVAIKHFELTLIESFVIPLTNIYGQTSHHNKLSFITRNVLQFLIELKKN